MSSIGGVLLPNEKVAWSISYKEGIIHRHLKQTYVITNLRVLAFDDLTNALVVALPILETDLAIMNRQTRGNSFGVSGGRTYNSARTSKSIGTLAFTTNGVRRITIGGIADPQGVKNLFTTIKKESVARAKVQSKVPSKPTQPKTMLEITQSSFPPEIMNDWAKKIEQDARAESLKDIRFDIPDPNKTGFTIRCSSDDLPQIEKSFNKLIPQMPEAIGILFRKTLQSFLENARQSKPAG